MPERIVILIGAEEPQHRYVASRLAELPNSTIVIARHPDVPLTKKITRAAKRFGAVNAISRLLLKIALRITGESSRRNLDLGRVLGDPQFPGHVEVYRTSGVNSVETQTLLRELAPDILCVYGTYIVSDLTLSIAPIALNLHTGISPRYRGADCEFWPLHQGELNYIGATVHACTSDVDGGLIYSIAPATMQAQDGLGAVFGRCVVIGSSIYKTAVQDLISERGTKAVPQNLRDGKEYKAVMRGWIAEFRVMLAIRRGLIRDYVKGSRQHG